MSQLDTNKIKVLNFNESQLFVSSAKDDYKFAPSNGITPTINFMPIQDLQYICSNTNTIVNGWLTFEEDEKEEIFELLRVHDWKDILTNEQIRDIILNPTMEGLQKIIDIKDQSYFERVRMELMKIRSEQLDISYRVQNAIDRRFDELQRRQRISDVEVTPRDVSVSGNNDETKRLAKQNEELQSQLDEMKAMMAQLLAAQGNISEVATSKDTSEDPKPAPTPRKSSRSKK